MRYLFYFLTMALLFAGGMLVGNNFLPTRDASLAASVSVPELSSDNPIFQTLTREQAQKDLEQLNQALTACPVVVSEEKDHLLHRILLRLAIENFELKKTVLELEIAKNNTSNRPTKQFTQAATEYNQARENVEKLAAEFFPPVTEPKAVEQATVETQPAPVNPVTPAIRQPDKSPTTSLTETATPERITVSGSSDSAKSGQK